ncbi:MAG: RidA family protein [Actinobacteria bacterium]|nr:RidA family protein [Actinomycetota bacterium]
MPTGREIVEVEGIAPPFGGYSHGAIGGGRVLHAAGTGFGSVLKLTAFVTDRAHATAPAAVPE